VKYALLEQKVKALNSIAGDGKAKVGHDGSISPRFVFCCGTFQRWTQWFPLRHVSDSAGGRRPSISATRWNSIHRIPEWFHAQARSVQARALHLTLFCVSSVC
jgi:hypothetical protein